VDAKLAPITSFSPTSSGHKYGSVSSKPVINKKDVH